MSLGIGHPGAPLQVGAKVREIVGIERSSDGGLLYKYGRTGVVKTLFPGYAEVRWETRDTDDMIHRSHLFVVPTLS